MLESNIQPLNQIPNDVQTVRQPNLISRFPFQKRNDLNSNQKHSDESRDEIIRNNIKGAMKAYHLRPGGKSQISDSNNKPYLAMIDSDTGLQICADMIPSSLASDFEKNQNQYQAQYLNILTSVERNYEKSLNSVTINDKKMRKGRSLRNIKDIWNLKNSCKNEQAPFKLLQNRKLTQDNFMKGVDNR